MTTYILLRNNKETTPLTLDELKRLGLKADDLVWVEGQSVCWLNPGQITELKTLVGLAPEEVIIPQQVQEMPTKKVFVSLPPKEKQPSSEPEINPVSEIETKWAGYAGSNPEPELVETKYSKPLDEIKEIYLKNLEKRNKGFEIPPQIKKAGLYAALVLTGIIAGIMIKKTGAQKETVLSASETKPVPNEIPQTITNSVPETANYQDAVTDAATDQQSTTVMVNNRTPVTQKSVLNTIPDQNLAKEEKTEALSSAVTETAVIEPEEKKEEEKPVRKISMSEVRSQVSVKTNKYDVGSFGGIKNLKLTITNHSKYELDKVGVEVQYLKPLNEFLRSEVVSVQSLSPGETKVIEVPKSNRGVKVSCKVSSIKSKDFSDDTAGL